MWFMNRIIWVLWLPLLGWAATPITRAGGFEVESVSSRDALAVAQCAERQDHCLGAIRRLRDRKSRVPDYLSPREHDTLEQSLAEYLVCRAEFEQIARRQSSTDAELANVSLRCKAERDVQLASLPLDDPPPIIVFPGKEFCVTGKFAFAHFANFQTDALARFL